MNTHHAGAVAAGANDFHFHSRVDSHGRHPTAQMAPSLNSRDPATLPGRGTGKGYRRGVGNGDAPAATSSSLVTLL